MVKGDKIQCEFLQPTDQVRRYLRRYGGGNDCPTGGNKKYHNAKVHLDDIVKPTCDEVVSGDLWSHQDSRWPTHCSCGRAFEPKDEWQLNVEHLWLRENGELITREDAPIGSMWYADWYRFCGPDGHCLVVKTPSGEWIVDAPASGKTTGWDRHGIPPNVTAKPSIWINKPDGYHGFLTDGYLIEV